MTHPNSVTNGASLEDCHTNFFALTDLCGIKWRRLCVDNVFCVDPLDDPVLVSYTKCLANDILCVWRRLPSSNSPYSGGLDHGISQQRNSESHQLNYPKELWLFWYGEEPDLSNILCSELSESDQGSWEVGLSYECRTLLFKALHNLIERYLISHDFARLGRWFVQPHSGNEKSSKSPHLTFKFNFFVHGESTVCASVDVREHPAVCRLDPSHVLQAQSVQNGVQVILGPYGLQGILTGQSFKDSNHATSKLMDEWKQFFPLPNATNENLHSNFQDNSLPVMIEVLVAGVKMKYPSCYVFVTELENNPNKNSSSPGDIDTNASNGANPIVDFPPAVVTPLTSPSDNLSLFLKPSIENWSFPESGRNKRDFTPKLVFRVCQDNSSSDSASKHFGNWNSQSKTSQTSSESTPPVEDAIGQWNTQDPAQKVACTCLKCKSKQKPTNDKKAFINNGNPSGSHNPNKKGERNEKSHIKYNRGFGAFHRRNLNENFENIDSELSRRLVHANQSQPPVISGTQPPVNSECLPQLRSISNNGPQDMLSSVSPHSVAPSPLLASCATPSQTPAQPASDPTMPKLSPHPPAIHEQENIPPTNEITEETKPLCPKTPASVQTPHSQDPIKIEPFSPYVNNPSVEQKPSEMQWNQQNANPSAPSPLTNVSANTESNGIKRPVLTSLNYEEYKDEDLRTGLLYDYSLLHAWSYHPVKRFKPEVKNERYASKPNQNKDSIQIDPDISSFQDGDNTNSVAMAAAAGSATQVNVQSIKTEEEEKSSENKENLETDDGSLSNSNPEDPANQNGSPNTSKPPVQLSSFTREKDLIVTGINDLAQIFDTSGDDSDGDNSFQAHTPPGSNKPATNASSDEAVHSAKNSRNSSNTVASLGAAELVRMFPTPPSLEHNPAPSPCTTVDGSLVDVDWMNMNKEKSDVFIGSPAMDPVKDWTYVFKVPERQIFIRSSKYAPLSNLPSSLLPPLNLPPDCVYKPWQQYSSSIIDKPQPISHMNMLPPEVERTPHGSVRSSMAPSPMTMPAGMDQRLPMNFELPSPASNASSYINKNMNSVDSSVISHVPEAHSLLVNVVLSDSLLNLFKDHNFDSCTMCVCNLNIRGADADVYLPGPLLPSRTDEAQYKCTCGFSAIRNRHLSYKAGLFYEDEFEITGIKDEGLDKRKVGVIVDSQNQSQDVDHKSIKAEQLPPSLMDLLLSQSLMSYSTANSLHRTAMLPREYSGPMLANSSLPKMPIEMMDACEVCFLARDTGKQAIENVNNNSKIDDSHKYSSMHRWPHIAAKPPTNSQDVIRVMKTIQPMLQDAIQKKRTTRLWETTYTISGPLTWRQFHRLAGRGTEDQCEPQPVPSLLVGYDKEWLAVSPFAIKYWEKLLLEPYAVPRDVAYIVLAPENEFILEKVRIYFKELSRTYELCHMGRHCPITKVLRDGIMRIGKTAAKKVADEPVDEWFSAIGNTPVASKLKLYAQVCRHRLGPHLATEQLDRNLLDCGSDKPNEKQENAVPMHPPATPDNSENKDVKSSENDSTDVSTHNDSNKENKPQRATRSIQELDSEDDLQIPAVVIYMVDPFTYLDSRDEYSEVNRLTMLGLLRCYAELIKSLPEKMQSNINLQIVSLETILNFRKDEDRSKSFDKMKGMAFSVFTQCRRMLSHLSTVKSLTGFGPAASQDLFLKRKDEKNLRPFSLFSPAYILAPTKDKQTELSELFGDRREKSGILFCSYCLSEDQQWLIASCTDERGELMDTSAINIGIPNRTRRKKASARKVGLAKLVDFLLGVMSTRTHPWRLVVGRLGRMGHGELKGWNNLLSKKSLMRASRHLKEMCKQCSYLGPMESPVILSACLVNIEPDSALTILYDQYTPDERFSSCNSCPLSTPHDASCTHILVFPTSAITQSSQATFQQEHIDPLGAEDIFSALNEDLQVDQDINAIFNWTESPVQSPVGSPNRGGSSQPGSPGINSSGRQDPFHHHSQNLGSHSMMGDVQEETAQLAQQPLALGYYVSTAKTGPLPKWFWSSCSHLENSCPSFLKSALLIHSPSAQQNSEDLLHSNAHVHPLDSNLTTDVLRYVLEGYNSLSWLSIDPTSHDRRSCLPVHIQVLMQMYHMMQSLV